MSRLTVLLLLSLVGSTSSADDKPRPNPYTKQLAEAGVEATVDGLAEYLKSLLPTEESQRLAVTWIEQLGDSDFRTRQQAEEKLVGMTSPPVELLTKATESNDPEVRFRAHRALQRIKAGESTITVRAVLGFIAHDKVPGLADPLLEFLPHWDDAEHQFVGGRALKATATKDDAALLRKALASETLHIRLAAVDALIVVLEDDAAEDLKPLLDDEQELLRLRSARALANIGQRDSLAALVKLLESDDITTRNQAVFTLRAFTGENFKFVPYGKEDDRADALTKWQTWLADQGGTAKLHFPLADTTVFHGRTLMSLWPDTLREIDSEGNVIFEKKGFQYVWGCQGMPDGRRIVSDFRIKEVRLYGADGELIWHRKDLPGPVSDSRLLPNGNVLLALAEAQKVAEINQEGKVVWEVPCKGRPTTAQRLPNGNTLVNTQNNKAVIEIDPSGKIVWKLDGLNNALTAQPLPNGNVLVCEMNLGQAVEYNRDGKVVWKKEGFDNACQAQRLPNGNTLVSDQRGMHEIAPDGEEVWSLKVPRGRFWRY